MENLIEEYSQYLEKPDIDGAKIFYYSKLLLESKNVGIDEHACTEIVDEYNSFSIELCLSANFLTLIKRKTEFRPRTRLKKIFLNQKGVEFIRELVEKAKKFYANEFIEELNSEIRSLAFRNMIEKDSNKNRHIMFKGYIEG